MLPGIETFQTIRSESQGKLASVVDLMCKDMPDNPLPCVRRLFFSHKGRGWKKVFQISGSPAGQGVSNHVPGLLKHGDQWSCLFCHVCLLLASDDVLP